jgi:hypothetical protein
MGIWKEPTASSSAEGADMFATWNCSECEFAQIVKRTGQYAHGWHIDNGDDSSAPVCYSIGDRTTIGDGPWFYSSSAGGFLGVSVVGVPGSMSCQVKGGFTWGFSIDSHGNLTTSSPTLASHQALATAIKVMRRSRGTPANRTIWWPSHVVRRWVVRVAPAMEVTREARFELEKLLRRRAHPNRISRATADWPARG